MMMINLSQIIAEALPAHLGPRQIPDEGLEEQMIVGERERLTQRHYHVVLGTPPDHLAALRDDADQDGETFWTINLKARPGDGVLFYMIKPVSSIVAVGRVASRPERVDDPQSDFDGYTMATIDSIVFLPRPLPRARIQKRLPRWAYWITPVRSQRVQPVHYSRLEKLLGEFGLERRFMLERRRRHSNRVAGAALIEWRKS
jgi:hypothetical protein